ncbi:MAG: hypothetical protein ACRDAU_08565 [Clostridium sp.]
MKIGLDSTRREFSKGLVRKLEEENLFLVDMYLEKKRNEGYEVYKKVMDANKSRLDLFIGVYLDEKESQEEEVAILYDCSFIGEKFASYIYDCLRNEYGNDKLSLRCGTEFYILKETKSPAFLIKGNLSEKTKDIEESLEKIIKNIFKMEIK